jgi:uncharacterized lipoprotein NlpE involved in copper resistance
LKYSSKSKSIIMKRVVIAILVCMHVFGIIGCGKDNEGDGNNGTPRTEVPAELQGSWIWANGGSIAVFDANTGVYRGPEIGMAQKITFNADGTGEIMNYIGSQTDKYYIFQKGTYVVDKTKNQVTFHVVSGTYEKNGSKRKLAGDELYPGQRGSDTFYYNVVTADKTYMYKKDDPNADNEDYIHSTRFTKM